MNLLVDLSRSLKNLLWFIFIHFMTRQCFCLFVSCGMQMFRLPILIGDDGEAVQVVACLMQGESCHVQVQKFPMIAAADKKARCKTSFGKKERITKACTTMQNHTLRHYNGAASKMVPIGDKEKSTDDANVSHTVLGYLGILLHSLHSRICRYIICLSLTQIPSQ